jgi:nucleotide-binding universal stress UspA family protein
MKQILFPTDFSTAAEIAFVYALNLAKVLKAEITTLHVYQLPDINTGHLPITLSKVYNSIELEAFENYKDAIPELRRIARVHNLTEIPVKHMLMEGDTIPTIIKSAKKEQADLIVMGTKGSTGLKQVFIGSVAGEIMEKAACLVLGVPEKSIFDGVINKICVTTDLKDEDKNVFTRIVPFAKLFNAEIHCVHVDLKLDNKAKTRMENWKSSLIIKDEAFRFAALEGTSMRQVVSDYITAHDIDILVMTTHERNFFKELFRFSRAKKMSYHLDTPVLAIPAQLV